MKVNQNSEYFQIPLQSFDDELKDWTCEFSKQIWFRQENSTIIIETGIFNGLIFRLKFAEKMFL
jgi:hypothetical protein